MPPVDTTAPVTSPLPASVAPLETPTSPPPVAEPLVLSTCSVPASTVVCPLYTLAAVNTRVPAPVFSSWLESSPELPLSLLFLNGALFVSTTDAATSIVVAPAAAVLPMLITLFAPAPTLMSESAVTETVPLRANAGKLALAPPFNRIVPPSSARSTSVLKLLSV